MKKIISTILFLMSGAAHAGLGFDGCYQLYNPGVMYPAFCLEGTAEEGINGSGVRLAIFGTNTAKVIHCDVSTSSSWGYNSSYALSSFTFEKNDVKELILELNGESTKERKQGIATLGNTKLMFIEVPTEEERLLEIANRECQR